VHDHAVATALKISEDLVEAARREAKLSSRSTTQQIEYWARVGRIIERAGVVDSRRLRTALAAELPFDELTHEERAVVLAQLEADVVKPAGDLALRDRLVAEGSRASELDPSGKIVTRAAASRPRRTKR
jgi:uncharacterized caspase-like protein